MLGLLPHLLDEAVGKSIQMVSWIVWNFLGVELIPSGEGEKNPQRLFMWENQSLEGGVLQTQSKLCEIICDYVLNNFIVNTVPCVF